MRVVILLDRPFARRERRLLARLEVGLADEGVRLIHAVPREILETEQTGLYSRVVAFEPPGFPVPLRLRARRLVEVLRDSGNDGGAAEIDVIHCFSPAVWKLGLEVGRELNAGVCLEIWSAAAVSKAAECAGHSVRPAFTAADPRLAELVRSRLAGATLFETTWGVHAEPIDRVPLSASRAVAMLVIVDRSSPAFLESAMRGLADACGRDERLIAFVNTERAAGHAVWRLIRRLGLADRVSLITDAEARRETVLNLDALLIAEPGGRLRSMALDAMATGMPVIAAADSRLEVLADGVTARLVNRPDASDWAAAIASVLAGSEDVQRLQASAAAWVLRNRAASAHVASVLRVYDAIARSRGEPAGVAARA